MFHKSLNKLKTAFVFCVIVFAFTIAYYTINLRKVITIQRSIFNFQNSKPQPKNLLATLLANRIYCYKEQNNKSISYFADILDHEHQPTPGKSIFFLETSCWKNGIATLNSRQACAIESAAQQNPNRDVFVLFGSPVGVKTGDSTLPSFMNVFKQYPNIHLRNMNIWRFSNGTPIFDWLNTYQLFQSYYLVEQMSDIFRVIALYRYGGLYLDLDVIVQKNLDYLGENFIGNDWYEFANNAVFHFNNYGVAKNVTERMLRTAIKTHNSFYFQSVGPLPLTLVFSEICSTKNRTKWSKKRCAGFNIYPKDYFYAIPFGGVFEFFQTKNRDNALKKVEHSSLIHISNDVTKRQWCKVGEKNAYQALAEKRCPGVYRNSTLI